MFWRILKKDLRRKKTMNVILLLFIIMSTMFAAASVNNIISVSNGIDYYLDKAGKSDYYYLVRAEDGKCPAEEMLDKSTHVTSKRVEDCIYAFENNYQKNGKKLCEFSNSGFIQSVDRLKINIFDSNNEKITEVPEGKVYISATFAETAKLDIGSKFNVVIGNTDLELEYAGFAKDAILGAEMVDNPRFLINEKDYLKLAADEETAKYNMGAILYVDTDDIAALKGDMSEAVGILFDCSNETIKTAYIMNMMIASVFLVISVGLILVSFVVLRFTIGFTLTEEFREIGVMKALGLPNGKIRSLYLVKYLGISVLGAALGFFAGIPFGEMLLSRAEKTIMLDDSKTFFVSLLCCIAVVLIILLFCYRCTNKIKKMSPIDAVRSGQTGERFKKRSLISLTKSRLGSRGFLAINDILSAPKQFIIMIIVFAICISEVMVLANVANTLSSDKLISVFNIQESDVYYTDTVRSEEIMSGKKTIVQTEKEIEDILSENGLNAKVRMEALYKFPVSVNGSTTTGSFLQSLHTKTTDYVYYEGDAPGKPDEIAVTQIFSDETGAKIGDTIEVNIGGEQKEFIVTGLFQTMVNLGNTARFHEDVKIPDKLSIGSFGYQIDFDDSPDQQTIDERIEKMRDIFDTEKVRNTSQFIKDTTVVGDAMGGIKNLVLAVTVIIIVMISILMERSFISKEKSGIALMKAVGVSNKDVIIYHTARFGITVIISAIVASALCMPMTSFSINPVFAAMGAINGVDYEIVPWEIFGFYPVMILLCTIIAVFCTALYTKTIKSSDTASIE